MLPVGVQMTTDTKEVLQSNILQLSSCLFCICYLLHAHSEHMYLLMPVVHLGLHNMTECCCTCHTLVFPKASICLPHHNSEHRRRFCA